MRFGAARPYPCDKVAESRMLANIVMFHANNRHMRIPTVEIFARVYFRKPSHMRSFMKIKSSRNGEIALSFTDIGKPCPSRVFFYRRKNVF